jgi:hypothetical protein
MNADQKWKKHKAECSTCTVAKGLDLCCDEGQALYRARLADPNMTVRLTEKGKRGQA